MKKTKVFVIAIVMAAVMAVSAIPAMAASTSNTNVTLSAGQMSVSSITVENFAQVTLNGAVQTSNANVGSFTVVDARGNGQGWSLMVSATRFRNGGTTMHDGAMTLSGTTGTAVGKSDAFEQSYIKPSFVIRESPASYISVPQSKGKGTYNFAGGKLTLEIWPSEAISGTYTSTVTFDMVPYVN
jgi:hypothetical protein